MRRSVALIAAVTLALAGCGHAASKQLELRVGQTGWTQSAAALKVAGLDNTPYKIDWPVFSGGDKQMEALRAGAVDVGQASEIPPIFAAVAGTPNFKVVAVQRASTLLQEVVVGKNSTITDIAGLNGKKVGYVPNTTAHYFLYKLLEQAGLSWRDITPAPLLPKDGVAALGSGSIDALASYGNSIITVHQSGGRAIGTGKDILSGNFQWLASDKVIADDAERGAVVDLIARLNKAYAYIRAGHQQEYAQAVSDATHQPLADALNQLKDQEAQRPTTFGPTDATAIASQQQVADAFTQLGAIPGKLDVSSIWTDKLNPELTAALATGTS
ncbi:MAG TPA: ABC transporter substrate-binding protein [Actinoplanes sp.]|nr:ABC transporter substrate-binding protein [Actinoplanes sp.]